MTKPQNLPALLNTLKVRAHTEAILREGDPHYDLDKGEASAWDKTVTPETVLRLVQEIEALQAANDAYQWTSTIKRPDGLVVTATIELPEGHPGIAPDPRPWNPDGDWTLKEMSEIAYMSVNAVHGVVERNFQSRHAHKRQDHYWAQNLDMPAAEAIEAPKS
ncbi:hypothetical protein SEA_SONALI_67 [Arthrobacter phage Sonali]|uniref:Uncharacterized protein n=1 Tax=Arthrobacter phage Sonali TaxID=2510495 RepID=A0A411CQG9_9CAUD|nr:hypothetical protein HOV09_gp67 [Arthrobacter phage Sonali]QAY16179.1 hypothetical protein SEA_SONALI_67 [Arthrobacter phage Sonali]